MREWAALLGLQPRLPLFKPPHNVLPPPPKKEMWIHTRARTLGSVHALGHQFPSPTGKKGMLPGRKVGGSYSGLCCLLKLHTTG